jgi:hypothetical protein
VTDALAERGLLAPEKDTLDRPAGPDVPTDPPLPISPAKPAGWLEATAAEIAPTRITPVELVGAPAGQLNGQDTKPDAPPSPLALAPAAKVDATVAEKDDSPLSPLLLAPAAKVDATVAALSDAPQAIARLDGDLGKLRAGGVVSEDEPAAKVALVGPVGAITASILPPPVASDPKATLVPPPEKPSGTLSVTVPVEPATTGVPLRVTPVPTLPRRQLPVEAAPPPVELTAEISPAPIAAPVRRPWPPAAPAPVIKFNPAFPNVVVLPPPATGANSSIQSWTID